MITSSEANRTLYLGAEFLALILLTLLTVQETKPLASGGFSCLIQPEGKVLDQRILGIPSKL